MESWKQHNFPSMYSPIVQYKFLGFRANHSTSLTLIEVAEQLDTGSAVCGVKLDLQKASDYVSQYVLL
jgi:hypothetical protein